jgi:2-keto-3-deoxy-6-phosphogluconate aldolase
MSRLFDAYRAVHEQGFVPIFVHDSFDSKKELDACLEAGLKVVEYTLRRKDADTMIPWIRENYPDLYLLVGSTVDDERIVAKMRRLHPQLRSIAELEAFQPDGYISMLGWSLESIRKYSGHRLVMPTAETITEAFQQVGAGAHAAKMFGGDLDLVKRARLPAAFDFCPILVTGGMTPERIPEAINSGAVLIASGFDLMLKGQPADVSVKRMAEAIRLYVGVTQEARAKKWPEMARAIGGDRQTWLDSLPHYHPF